MWPSRRTGGLRPSNLSPDPQTHRQPQTTFVGIAEEHASPARSLVAYRNSETPMAEEGWMNVRSIAVHANVLSVKSVLVLMICERLLIQALANGTSARAQQNVRNNGGRKLDGKRQTDRLDRCSA